MNGILLGVKPFPQPSPAKNPGGDCFACALKAAVDHLFPEKPADFDIVWNAFMRETSSGDQQLSNTWPTMRSAPYQLHRHGYSLEVHADLVMPSFNVEVWSHSWWQMEPENEWAYRLEAWLAAGWVALAEMNFAGAGLFSPDGTMNTIDHFIVLDGQRHYWQRHATLQGAASLEHETHVVCSARGAYWIRTRDLLRKHGVAGLRLIRREKAMEYR